MKETRCGERYAPALSPCEASIAEIMRAVDDLPLVPDDMDGLDLFLGISQRRQQLVDARQPQLHAQPVEIREVFLDVELRYCEGLGAFGLGAGTGLARRYGLRLWAQPWPLPPLLPWRACALAFAAAFGFAASLRFGG